MSRNSKEWEAAPQVPADHYVSADMALLANRRVALDTITWSPGLHVPI